ncbi:DUF2007 domain-containing protein [Aeoliella sp. ICT_H6.2]|uniref:DUF2007 domain-containing protein n=1 Tax=Aeoliella straminimaris TaxID=2954799 RepID=A0A9X2F8Y8_9BACT|nr:DUF2007 domain-containing protein [Aeoliella straminimaris]MCO6044505.1 DUF2007 domain-containing protein [Aeoliella straminimaris]
MNDENPYKSPESRANGVSREHVDQESFDEADDSRLIKLTSFLTIADAQVCQAVLRQEGIDSFLENEGSVGVNWLWSNAVGGVKLLVPEEHLETAAKLLGKVQTTEQAKEALGDITFECEDCGAEITFPGDRRGMTETCPKCHEYVDVPD